MPSGQWAGIAIYFPSASTDTASAATRRHYSNYKAESEALMWTHNRRAPLGLYFSPMRSRKSSATTQQ